MFLVGFRFFGLVVGSLLVEGCILNCDFEGVCR